MNSFQPDDVDWNIIDLLRSGAMSNNAVARELNISEGTVRQRIKRLKDADILRVRGQINPDILPRQQLAIIGINLGDSRTLENKAREIGDLQHVLSASIVSGRFDVMAEVLVDSNQGLVDFLTRQLSTVDGVISSETFLMLKSFHRFV
ncbi:Lrp/AsnC family transcriptional regulator [Salinispira pacifica]|uniref:Transcriptional regulator, AsnC family n=1 Tax=Salinispira pacifica TaxID=1307761 RepID=V5WGX7_9SPIO|nr:Lrp/AsnC family transcriptional regulator [Salinispira pacifica]AHC14426.1 Transcriptional regulator, AsnC family [Salinispira pacifica]